MSASIFTGAVSLDTHREIALDVGDAFVKCRKHFEAVVQKHHNGRCIGVAGSARCSIVVKIVQESPSFLVRKVRAIENRRPRQGCIRSLGRIVKVSKHFPLLRKLLPRYSPRRGEKLRLSLTECIGCETHKNVGSGYSPQVTGIAASCTWYRCKDSSETLFRLRSRCLGYISRAFDKCILEPLVIGRIRSVKAVDGNDGMPTNEVANSLVLPNSVGFLQDPDALDRSALVVAFGFL